jgi:hypothetical protein
MSFWGWIVSRREIEAELANCKIENARLQEKIAALETQVSEGGLLGNEIKAYLTLGKCPKCKVALVRGLMGFQGSCLKCNVIWNYGKYGLKRPDLPPEKRGIL